MTFDWSEIWTHMGMVARGVLFTLLIMSIWSAGIIVERLLRFSAAAGESLAFGQKATQLLMQRNFRDVAQAVPQYAKSPLAAVIGSGVREYEEAMAAQEDGTHYDVIEVAERAIDRSIEMELARLRRGLGGLASISSSAPFVGLFGTTFGIINSFRAIGLSGQGDLATVAPGIAEALLTTALGIFVALPAVWFFNYLTGRIDTFSVDLHHAGSETIDYFIKDLGRRKDVTKKPAAA